MRNLKRALSLALAAMMLIGMMVVSAGAASKDFTDKDEITHSEAVNTLVALNVISGKEDGSYFDPTGTLTRAEMAKLVTYVLNGGSEPVLGTKVTPTYSDIKGHWAEAYIEYCTSMEIIVGDGAGKFNPEGTLTASQCAKMLLTAMGYKADVFGFTGSSWEINTNRYANDAGLYDELNGVSASAPITRDNAAQMVYNAIQAPLMVRSWSQNQQTGQVTETYNLAVAADTLGNIYTTHSLFIDKFDGKVWIGTFDGNYKTGTTTTDGEIQVTGKLESVVTDKSGPASFPYDLDISNIGEQVKVLFKDGASGTKDQPDKKDTIYGVYNTGATQVVTATRGDVKDLKSTDAKINIGGTKYNTADAVTVNYNYGANIKADLSAKGTSSANSALTGELKASNGDTIKAIVNPETGKIDTIYVVESKIAVVTAVNSEKVTLSKIGSIKIADNDVYDGVAKGDVVVVTTLYNSDATKSEAYSVVEKAQVISGTVTRYKANADDANASESVTLDGTVYTVYNKAAMQDDVAGKDFTTKFVDSCIGETFDLYMVNGYVGAAIQTSESANNYSVVLAKDGTTASGNVFQSVKLQVMAADGTKTIITVSDDSAKTGINDYNVGDIVVYTGDASNAVVTIKSTSTTGGYNDSTKTFGGKVTTADCVLFAEITSSGTAKYKAYNIRSLDKIPEGAANVVEDDGRVVAVYMDLSGAPAGATSTTVYGIVTAYNGQVKIDGNVYHEYTAASNDKTYTMYFSDTSNTEVGLKTGNLISLDPASDDIYTKDTVKKVADNGVKNVYVKEYSEADGTLTYYTSVSEVETGNWVGAGQETLALDDECAIVYVDAKNDVAGSDIGINAFDSVTGYANAAIMTETQDGAQVIVAIFVETSGECAIDK